MLLFVFYDTTIIAKQGNLRNGNLLVIFFNLSGGDCMTNLRELPSVIYCDRERLTKASRFGPVIRQFIVIECNETGRGGFIINGKEYTFGPRQCYVLFPGDTVVQLSDGEEPRGGIYCILDAPQLTAAFKKAGITPESPFIPEARFPHVQYWIGKMLEDFSTRDAGTDLRQAGNIYGLAGALLQETPAEENDAVAKVMGMMEANYPEALSIDELSRQVGLNRTYFSAIFKEKTGKSPYQYLTALRIHKARTLLTQTELSVTEVAALVGMDPRNFARCFKKETGKTPLHYKKKPPKA